MRNWTGFLAGLSLLALMGVGCHHTAGICDCCTGCCGMPPVGPVPIGVAPAAAPIMPHAPISSPVGPSARSEPSAADEAVPVAVHMPRPIIRSED